MGDTGTMVFGILKIQIYNQGLGSQNENMHPWLINTGWIANSGILKEYNLNLL